MTNHVELTEAERELLWDLSPDSITASVTDVIAVVAGIVKARMADVWDEAFKEGEDYAESWHMATTPHKEPNPYRATVMEAVVDAVRAAVPAELAEPKS